jgi:hypothetical protein
MKGNGHADTSAPTETISFDEAVIEGKAIIAKIEEAERGQLRLGELADQLETQYGDRTLAKFAKALNIAPCTLARYRDVYRAWDGAGIRAPGRLSYAVLRELATHPDRAEIIRDRPDLTKRAAQDEMRKHKNGGQEKKEAAQEAEWLRHNRKWFKDLVTLANEATSAAAFAHNECTTDEQWRRLLDAIEPGQLMYVGRGGRMLVWLADLLERLLEEPETVDLADLVAQWGREDDERRAQTRATAQEAPTVQVS